MVKVTATFLPFFCWKKQKKTAKTIFIVTINKALEQLFLNTYPM
jgi:hypothetical protein